jgi:hypothetical protein
MTTGQQLFDTANKHVGEEYILGVVVPKNNANWKGPWDCAELLSWAVFQLTQGLFGCTNDSADPRTADAYSGSWGDDGDRYHTKIPSEEAAVTTGAAVLRYPTSSAFGHIVISDGKGGTIEAHSHNSGVINGSLHGRRWDTGVLVPWIEYGHAGGSVVIEAPKSPIYFVTTPRMKGPKIKELQSKLKKAGFDPGIPDGVYGDMTAAAVRAFQLTVGLLPDSEYGPATDKKLAAYIKKL